jgi:hypothetical protein
MYAFGYNRHRHHHYRRHLAQGRISLARSVPKNILPSSCQSYNTSSSFWLKILNLLGRCWSFGVLYSCFQSIYHIHAMHWAASCFVNDLCFKSAFLLFHFSIQICPEPSLHFDSYIGAATLLQNVIWFLRCIWGPHSSRYEGTTFWHITPLWSVEREN